MSAMKGILIGLLLLPGCGDTRESENQVSGAPATVENAFVPEISWTSHHLRDEVAETLTGPGGTMRIDFRGENLRITNASGDTLNLNVVPPASIRWNPRGSSVAINNGNGSGQISHIMIVSNDNGRLSILEGVEEQLKAYFAEQTRCRIRPIDISVGPYGWAIDGATIWVYFESWDRRNFCDSGPARFAQYDPAQRAVVAHLSEAEAVARFCPDPNFRWLPCQRYRQRRDAS